MDAVVLDAQPLVAYLTNEPGADLVYERLVTHRAAGAMLVSSVNWCEVLYVVRRSLGVHATATASRLLANVPVSVLTADEGLATFAAEIKFRHRLGLGDAFAAGLAIATDSPLLTGDAAFLPLVEHGLKLDWVGPETA